MLLSDAGRDYIQYIKHEQGYSPRTVEVYQSRFRRFEGKWLPANGYPDADLTAFSAPVLRRYLYALSDRKLRPRTIRGMFCPLVVSVDDLPEGVPRSGVTKSTWTRFLETAEPVAAATVA